MKYLIEWIEQKPTISGKQKAEARLKGEDGIVHEKVNIWGDFPNYASIVNGGTIEGTITPASDPKYPPSLKPSQTPKTASTGAYKAKAMNDAMEKKAEYIGQAQNHKEQGIKVASTFSAAWNTAIAEYQEEKRSHIGNTADLEQLFKKWRAFYWNAFDVEATDYPPFD